MYWFFFLWLVNHCRKIKNIIIQHAIIIVLIVAYNTICLDRFNNMFLLCWLGGICVQVPTLWELYTIALCTKLDNSSVKFSPCPPSPMQNSDLATTPAQPVSVWSPGTWVTMVLQPNYPDVWIFPTQRTRTPARRQWRKSQMLTRETFLWLTATPTRLAETAG